MRSTYMDTETMLVIHSERFNEIVTKAVKEMEQDSLVLSEDGTYIPDGQTEAVPLSKNKKRIFKITTKVFRLIRNMLYQIRRQTFIIKSLPPYFSSCSFLSFLLTGTSLKIISQTQPVNDYDHYHRQQRCPQNKA